MRLGRLAYLLPSLLPSLMSLTACTGFSLGENGPGGDTWTEPPPTNPGEHKVGAIGVERDEDQLWVVHEENRAGEVRGRLAAIDPVAGTAVDVLDVSGTEDRRVIFPANDRMLLMAQDAGTEHLVLFDTTTDKPLAQTVVPTWYWGTRTAPSGRALVVADNADPKAPLHVIDTATLGHQVIQHGGDLIEAMWNHSSDVLIALSVKDPFTDHPLARLLRYDLNGVDLSAPLPAPTVVWELAGFDWDFLFSFTWIGISPDDRYAVFPVTKHVTGATGAATLENVLLVLDQQTGGVAILGGSGPVGFTADGKWIVTYGARPDGQGEDIWLIDPATHAKRVVQMPWLSGVSFFPMRESAHIAVAPAWTQAALAIYDAGAGTMATTEQLAPSLQDFVSRPGHDELFLESAGVVWDLTLADAGMSVVPLPASIGNINVRPHADQAVASDALDARVFRLDMAAKAQVGEAIALPSPFGAFHGATLSTARTATRAPNPHPRLTTRREHDGDAIVLDRR